MKPSPERGAKIDIMDGSGLTDNRPNRIDRQNVRRELFRQLPLRPNSLKGRQYFIGAIAREEFITHVRSFHFPNMLEKKSDLPRTEVQPVLENVPILGVIIFLDFDVVGPNREIARIESKQAEHGLDQKRVIARH